MIKLLHNFIEQSAGKFADSIAVKMAGKSESFTGLNTKATALAVALQKSHLKKGDKVVLCLGNAVETIISFWAILKAGGVAIPIGADLTQEKIEYILNDSEAAYLITNTEKVDLLDSFFQTENNLQKVIVLNKEKETPLFLDFYEELNTNLTNLILPPKLIDLDLAAILYTSGSTGEPKGVMLTHQNMVSATHSLNEYLDYRPSDKVLCAIPLSFDYGLYQMIMSGAKGATLVLEKEFTWPVLLIKTILVENISILPAVPSLVMLLHNQNLKSKKNMSSVRMVTNTGAALTSVNVEMIKKTFTKAAIFSMYGLTECKRCTYLPPNDIDKKPNSVGIAIPNTELWLVDENNEKITTPNEAGQLVIRGANVMKGYWKKPQKTAEKIKQHPITGENLLYTGDMCRLDEDGYLYFEGRIDEIVKSRGIKVSPKEIEDFLVDIGGVQTAAVVGCIHPEQGEVLYAYVTIGGDTDIANFQVKEICKKNLQPHQVPIDVEIIAALPKTPNGKFNKLRLKEMAQENLQLVEA